MRDLWNLFRGTLPRVDGLNYAFEKGGVTLENQPIPWCADSVLIGAVVLWPPQLPFMKGDFELCVGGDTYPPESQRREESGDSYRLQFRVPVPARSTTAELVWRDRSLGQTTLPVFGPEEFAKKVSVQMPTANVRLGEQTVACQTFVATQGQGLIVSGVLQSPTSLVPLQELGLRVEMRREEGGPSAASAVYLSHSQLQACQALVALSLPRPRRMGTWQITWYLGEKPLASHTIKAISQKQFQRSLHVTGTRFVLQNKRGAFKVEKFVPDLKGYVRIAPCFYVASSERGMAGKCILQVRAQLKDSAASLLLGEQEILLTDGPCPFVPGTLEIGALNNVKLFELRCGRTLLANLSPSPVPTAAFTTEGGFAPASPFEWSPSADEQLQERLGKLLG